MATRRTRTCCPRRLGLELLESRQLLNHTAWTVALKPPSPPAWQVAQKASEPLSLPPTLPDANSTTLVQPPSVVSLDGSSDISPDLASAPLASVPVTDTPAPNTAPHFWEHFRPGLFDP